MQTLPIVHRGFLATLMNSEQPEFARRQMNTPAHRKSHYDRTRSNFPQHLGLVKLGLVACSKAGNVTGMQPLFGVPRFATIDILPSIDRPAEANAAATIQ